MLVMRGEVRHQPVRSAGQAEVGLDRSRITDFRRKRVDPVLAASNKHQPPALGGKLARKIDAQASGRPGDQSDGLCHAALVCRVASRRKLG